jgi:hypothetical protein
MSTAIWVSLFLMLVIAVMIAVELLRHSLSRWIRRCWHDPYDRNLGKRIYVRVVGTGPDGKAHKHDAPPLFAVSRHGLVQQAITCPCCGPSADLSALGFREVIETRWGEALVCPQCNAYLLASPDDDIDKVSTKKKYDESVYHKFVRPEARSDLPGQRTLRRAPDKGDWVVITEHISMPTTDGSPPQDLWSGEGRIEDINLVDGTAKVSLGGVSGLAGSDYGGVFATLPLRALAVMATNTLRANDRVSVIRGPRRGETGAIRSITMGKPLVVFPDNSELEIPIERLLKVQDTN